MSSIGLILSDDLIDSSRVTTTARSLGRVVQQVRQFPQLLLALQERPIACLLLDLHHPDLNLNDLLARLQELTLKPRMVGFGSHVDAARLKAARQAGLDVVMPRSQFFESIESDLPSWFS